MYVIVLYTVLQLLHVGSSNHNRKLEISRAPTKGSYLLAYLKNQYSDLLTRLLKESVFRPSNSNLPKKPHANLNVARISYYLVLSTILTKPAFYII